MVKSGKDDDTNEPEEQEEEAETKEHWFHLLAKARKNNPLYSPAVLREMFVQGKIQFIMRILTTMNKHLKVELELQHQIENHEVAKSSKGIHISNTLNYTLAALLSEIDLIVEEQVTQIEQQPTGEPEEAKKEDKKKQVKQNNDFDDFFGGDDDDDDFDLMDDGMIDFDNLAQAKEKEPEKKKED
mmetsp:Transcript_31456/g.48117  ORF Transcript_31456/g.48117 Transcript_31456/m.48117 type:complete len:185 (+) Transcript_31456:925-1479(+)